MRRKRIRRGRMHLANWIGLSLIVVAIFGIAYFVASGQQRVQVAQGQTAVLFKKSALSWVFAPKVSTFGPGIYEVEPGTASFVVPTSGSKPVSFRSTLDGEWKDWLPFVKGRGAQVVSGSFSVNFEKFPLEDLLKRKKDTRIEDLLLEPLSDSLAKHAQVSSDSSSFGNSVGKTFATMLADQYGIRVSDFKIDDIHALEGEKVAVIEPLLTELAPLAEVPPAVLLRYAAVTAAIIFGALFMLCLLGGSVAGFGEVLVAVTGLPVAPFAGASNVFLGTDIDFWDFAPVGEALGAVGEALGEVAGGIDIG